MIVKTIGSDSTCDVCITDPSVSAFHLQLIRRDDGLMSVIDMGSEEGTFVNGNRISSEIILHAGDTVKAGEILVEWEKLLFQREKGVWKKWVFIGILALVVLVSFYFVAVWLKNSHDQRTTLFSGVYPKAQHVAFVEDGKTYEADAIKGQVVLVFATNVKHDQAKRLIESQGGSICAQIPKLHYYLTQTEEGKESVFMDSIAKYSKMLYSGRNFVQDFKMPRIAFLERYENIKDRKSHGDLVEELIDMGSGSMRLPVVKKDAIYGLNTNSIIEFYVSELPRSRKNQLLLLNMSFGPQAPVARSWDEMSLVERSNYTYLCRKELDGLLAVTHNCNSDNYLFIKAMGNEGIDDFDRVVFYDYLNGLDEQTKQDFEKHFLMVGSLDKRFYTGVSNSLSDQCPYSNFVTVDLTSLDESYRGTSAATALMTGWLAALSDRYALSAAECQKVIAAVVNDGANHSHLVSMESLDEKCKALFPDRKDHQRVGRGDRKSKPKIILKDSKRNQKKDNHHKIKKRHDSKIV